jgi:hypothetical protein
VGPCGLNGTVCITCPGGDVCDATGSACTPTTGHDGG